MKIITFFFLSSLFLVTLSACNSAFPENKSLANTNSQTSKEVQCSEVNRKPTTAKSSRTSKTYKIIGE